MKLETYSFGNLRCANSLVKILNEINDDKLSKKCSNKINEFYSGMKEIKQSTLSHKLKQKFIRYFQIEILNIIYDLEMLNKNKNYPSELWTHFENVIVSIARQTMKEIKHVG